jgi:hypothetical protein
MISVIKSSAKDTEDRFVGMALFSFLTAPLFLLTIAAGISAL